MEEKKENKTPWNAYRTILISGTPGTGKTALGTYLAQQMSCSLISLGDLVVEEGLYTEWEEERQTRVIDEEKVIARVSALIEDCGARPLVLESHYIDLVPDMYCDIGFLLRTHPKELERRFEARQYPRPKVLENIQAEILADCASYLTDKSFSVGLFEIETTQKSVEEVGEIALSILKDPTSVMALKYEFGPISWLSRMGHGIEKYFQP